MPFLQFETIPNDMDVNWITFIPKYSVICSVGKAAFQGTAEITYQPKDELIELESFEHSLHDIAMNEFTVESFCAFVFNSIIEKLGGVKLTVEVYAETVRHAPVTVLKSNT